MKKNIKKKCLALSLLLMLLLSACQTLPAQVPEETPAPEETPKEVIVAPTSTPEPTIAPDGREMRTFTDLSGAQVTYAYPPKRIVSLQPNTTEILYAVGAGELVVGTDIYSDYPEEAKATEKMGDYANPNIERIIAANPDLVIAGGALASEHTQRLSALGIPVAFIEAQNYDDIYTSIELIGGALGGDYLTNAAALSSDILLRTAVITDITEKYTHRPSVYYVISYGEMGNWTSGPDSFINAMMEMAGGAPVTNDAGERWLQYSLETLVKQNPDIIIIPGGAQDAEALKTEAGYKDLSAVKNGRVCVVAQDIASRPGPRVILALEAFYEALKPLAK